MDDDTQARLMAHDMVATQLRSRGVVDQRILEVMARVPRHRFVPHVPLEDAYADKALPTACGQTISQPYIVAYMTQLLAAKPGMRVLEVGTGSGYQSAILAELGCRVVSVEKVPELAANSREILEKLGYSDRVTIVQGDGSRGWPGLGPYDRILVTAGAPSLPEVMKEQVVEGGRIVIPVGDREVQTMLIYDLRAGQWTQQQGLGCRFVPLLGDSGWPG